MMDAKKYVIGPSAIQGNGVLATAPISKGEWIEVVVYECSGRPCITGYFGRYVNHSYRPNSVLSGAGNNYNLVALRDIRPGEEIVADYNFTPAYLSKPGKDFV